MIVTWLLIAAGLAILLVAGDLLVRGAVAISLRLGISALVVSLTVVAFGTSAPELVISVQSVLEGKPGVAIGNVVGSNIANVLLILGLPAFLAGMGKSLADTRTSFLMMAAASLLLFGLALLGPLGPVQGAILLAAFFAMLAKTMIDARRHRAAIRIEDIDQDAIQTPWWKAGLFTLLGLIGLPLGASLFIDNAIVVARDFGLSETVIGLTLVALGTSLPELATTIIAAIRRQADVALGNVIGSNLFNILSILGVASLFGSIPVPPEMVRFDLPVMLFSAALLIPFVYFGQALNRVWGFALAALYVAYMVALL